MKACFDAIFYCHHMAYRGPEVALQVPAMITGVGAGISGDE